MNKGQVLSPSDPFLQEWSIGKSINFILSRRQEMDFDSSCKVNNINSTLLSSIEFHLFFLSSGLSSLLLCVLSPCCVDTYLYIFMCLFLHVQQDYSFRSLLNFYQTHDWIRTLAQKFVFFIWKVLVSYRFANES